MLSTKKPVPWRPRRVEPMRSSGHRRSNSRHASFEATTALTRLVHHLLRLCRIE